MKASHTVEVEKYISDLLTETQKTKHILHMDLHFREETDGFFFDDIEEKNYEGFQWLKINEYLLRNIPILFYTDFSFSETKKLLNSSFSSLSNLSYTHEPQLNSYMSAVNQNKAGLEK